MTVHSTCFMMGAMRAWRFSSLLVLLISISVLSCNVPGLMGLGSTPTPSITDTPTPTLTPTPTPTPLPASRLDVAAWSTFKGEWDRAISEYQLVIAQAVDQAIQAEAQLGIGFTLVQAGRFDEAVQALNLYIESYPNHERLGQGFFHRARAYEALGQYGAAAADYEQYRTLRPGRIDAYVYESQGDALQAAGQPQAAINAYENALQVSRLTDDLAVEIKIARTYATLRDYRTALARYSEIYDRASSDYTKALMDYLRGQAHLALGEPDAAYGYYLHAVENYPLSYDTYLGLVDLVGAGVPVDELDRGLVDYFAGQYGVAVAAFNRYLVAFPDNHDGTAHYYMGLSLRGLGDYDGAIAAWDTLIEDHPEDRFWDEAWEEKAFTQWGYLDQYEIAAQTLLDFVDRVPDHPRAAEFLYDAAQNKERSGSLIDAADLWERLAVEYPSSEWTYRGLFLAGISRFRVADFERSRISFQNALAYAGDSSERARVYLWVGKTYQAQGDLENARAAWQLATTSDLVGYYGLRSGELLAGRQPFQPGSVFDFSTDPDAERQETERWMREVFTLTGLEPLSELDPGLKADLRMIRGDEFWQLGLYDQAKAEFDSLRIEFANDAETTYRLMHHFLELGHYQAAIYASKQILDLAGIGNAPLSSIPVYLSQIRFAPYFGELILPEALYYGLDPLFLLSVVRQESLFESFATSYADARGLMQVIPSTGQEIANRLGWPPNYTADDLYQPVVSVRFGAYYLAAQRDLFDGDLYAALVAYNAGPGNALIWKELAPDDPDLFLEIVRLKQPRDYVRVILWAYTYYRDLYASP